MTLKAAIVSEKISSTSFIFRAMRNQRTPRNARGNSSVSPQKAAKAGCLFPVVSCQLSRLPRRSLGESGWSVARSLT
jgi:hypothetical protein